MKKIMLMTSGYFCIDVITKKGLWIHPEELEELKIDLIYSIKYLHKIDSNIMNLFIGKNAEYIKLCNNRVKIKCGSGDLHKDFEDEFMKIVTSIFGMLCHRKWSIGSTALWYFNDEVNAKKIDVKFHPRRSLPIVKIKELAKVNHTL